MQAYADKNPDQLTSTAGNEPAPSSIQLTDHRPEATQMKELQEVAAKSPRNEQFAQLRKMAVRHTATRQFSIPKKENKTGLPDQLKTGVESLSGHSMDDVKVHYNSHQPAQLQAHAYAQGTDIHIAPGQEKHLPHEAWHVVQQKQGRVTPTMQMQRATSDRGEQAASQKRQVRDIAPHQVIQRALIVNGNEITDVNTWIQTYVDAEKYPEIAEVIKKWAADANYRVNHADDIALYKAAQTESRTVYESQNEDVAGSIGTTSPPLQVAYNSYPVWGAWYFQGLEYQDNSTGGWHSNRAGLLPGAPTADGEPTRYVEFRRPGAVGIKEVSKMERCVFNLLNGKCYPNAHYDGGYVEITGVPASILNRLQSIAIIATGLNEVYKEMSAEDKVKFPKGPTLLPELLRRRRSSWKESQEKKEEGAN